MTDDIDTIIRDLEAVFVRELAAASDRLRAAARVPAPSPTDNNDLQEYIAVGAAAFDTGISESRLRRLCQLHQIDSPGGFGLKRGGRWLVHGACYAAFCASRPRRGRQRVATSVSRAI